VDGLGKAIHIDYSDTRVGTRHKINISGDVHVDSTVEQEAIVSKGTLNVSKPGKMGLLEAPYDDFDTDEDEYGYYTKRDPRIPWKTGPMGPIDPYKKIPGPPLVPRPLEPIKAPHENDCHWCKQKDKTIAKLLEQEGRKDNLIQSLTDRVKELEGRMSEVAKGMIQKVFAWTYDKQGRVSSTITLTGEDVGESHPIGNAVIELQGREDD
jgi:hypothetical protein